jgi:hypothetical protein
LTKSDLYLESLPLFMSGRVELLDAHRLIRQLHGLERKASSTGRDTVDHGPGSHNDVSNAVAGALVLAAKGTASAPAGANPSRGFPQRLTPVNNSRPSRFAGLGAVRGSGLGGRGWYEPD